MKRSWLCLLLFMVFGFCLGVLPPPERSYNILMLLPASSKSHRNVFMPLVEGLVERGHKIVMLSNNEKPIENPNIKEIYHGLKHFRTDDMNMFEWRKNPANIFSMFTTILPQMARDIYKIPEVKELYARRKEFDLIIINHMFNEFIYPFAHEMPFITIATSGYDPRQSSVFGNLPNPAYIPNLFGGVDLLSVFGRLRNTFLHIMPAFMWRIWEIVPLMQEEITKHFPNIPPLLDIERNQSLALMNTHFTLNMPLPLLPTQVEVGGMHCRPGNPLPEDLKTWIEEAGSAGVVYFSLGSVVRGNVMPDIYKNMFIEAFRKMKQRVIWKFEGELDDPPKNVLIKRWLPQQDILAHPNVKSFHHTCRGPQHSRSHLSRHPNARFTNFWRSTEEW
ncbi:hypothetical protein SK128_005001 [Halocaridina rubra]|uniref:UDP-glycosyltransferase n=1 Tax=Halocaridina rubra TaxID=373956 RepID=A0AAN9AG71_HALRR